MEKFLRSMRVTTEVIEVLVSLALVVLAGGVLVSLAYQMIDVAGTGAPLTTSEFNMLIGTILEVFILVELFRIAIAYLRHENVVPTVLEAALVAVARKFVVFEGGENYLFTALALSSLLISVALAWWLLTKSRACEIHE
ncbi:MAG TPA: phosphate-starvation-inducible PsiE family protein [Coriobacteriia bacterium]|nr:phosphate-starvation-inducible PsiE family protein [Coriobacteriia bacterium]